MKIAVASGKGGTGKTTVSANLAAYLSETENVVLVDLDVEEPNSGLFFKMDLAFSEDKFVMIPEWHQETCQLCGNCQAVCNYHAIIKLSDLIMVFPQLCHSCYACSELCPTQSLPMVEKKMGELKHYKNAAMDFVESRLNIGEEQAVPLIKQTKKYVGNYFDTETLCIFDSPPGTSCPVVEATKDADLVILVTEPTPFGLHDLTLAVETMRALKKEFAVVINRYGIGNDGVTDYCRKENVPIIAKIPNMREIAERYSRGELLYKSISEVRNELDKIWNYAKKTGSGGNI